MRFALGVLCCLTLLVACPARGQERRSDRDESSRADRRFRDHERRETGRRDSDRADDRRHDHGERFEHGRDEWRREHLRREEHGHGAHRHTHRHLDEHRVEEYRRDSSQRSGLHELSRSVNSELLDITGALRSLDQSYSYSGFRNGNHAWVAGSSYIEPARRLDRLEIRRLEQRIDELERRRRVEHHHERREVCERCVVVDWRAGERLDAERRGRAHLDRDGRLQLARGSAVLRHGADDLVAACRESNELAVEAVFVAATDEARGPARIIGCSTDASARNFTLGQEGDRLVFRLRTTETDLNGTSPEVSLVKIRPGKRYHVVVMYRAGRLVCHLDGERVMETGAVEGTFANWTEQSIVIGDELDGDRDWAGTLERFSIRSCVEHLDDEHRGERRRDDR